MVMTMGGGGRRAGEKMMNERIKKGCGANGELLY
jgi:hypothetical protein